MPNDGNLLPRYLQLQKSLLSSLRLKDVLDAAIMQFSELAGGAKVALFLSDNETLALKLMAAKGYSDSTLDQVRVVNFSAESLLKFVVQKRMPAVAQNAQSAPDISASIMQRESSSGQMAFALVSANLLVGAVLMDVNNPQWLQQTDLLRDVADVAALAIANSILFGRSEYERERLSTLYKTSCALSGSVLRAQEVLQIAVDTAVILGNTPSCALLVYDANQNDFKLAAFKGLDSTALKEFDMSVRDTLAGACLRSGRIEYIGDGSREPYGMPRAQGGVRFNSVLALPMIRDSKPVGVIEVFSTENRAFHREQIELLESLTGQVATALNVAFTHESTAAQSMNDVHTGLYNRLHFEELLGKEVERSTRHSHEMSLLLIDIDHLGQLNEHLGQERGDEVIKYVARMLKSSLRDIDVPCRYGGNEFSVILPETSLNNATEVAERVRQKLRNEPCPGVGIVTVSIGVSAFPSNGADAGSVLRNAEQAIDVAKFEGRDRVRSAPLPQQKGGDISWEELSKQAKLSVLSERQHRATVESRLTVAPEYASWLTKTPSLVRRKADGEQ